MDPSPIRPDGRRLAPAPASPRPPDGRPTIPQDGQSMALTPSQKPTREWLLLVVSFLLVAGLVVPVWQWSGHTQSEAAYWAKWTPERLGRLLLGPEQIACYCCAVWAGFIVLSRYAEVRRQG